MYQEAYAYIHVKCFIFEYIYIDKYTYAYIHVATENKKDFRNLKES